MIVTLERFAYSPWGVFGRLRLPGFECFAVERPWKDNVVRESCIPTGRYPLVLGVYNRGGYPAYELLDVPGRSLIKVHKGNTMDDVLGCIAPGTELGFMETRKGTGAKWAVTASGQAFKAFMTATDGAERGHIDVVNLAELA